MKNILLLIASVIVTLLFLEAVIRVFDLGPKSEEISTRALVFSSNPRLRYTLKPGGVWNDRAWGKSRINREGYRGEAYGVKRRGKDIERVICLGDSITLGYRMEDGETYPTRLEKLLNENKLFGRSWEVFNFGVSGYNTINEVELLKVKGLDYRPDYVILQYCFNDHSNWSDFEFRSVGRALVKHRPLVSVLLNPLSRALARSRLFLCCAVQWRRFTDERKSLEKLWRESDYSYRGDIVGRGLAEFKKLAEEYNFRPLVVIFPAFEDKDNFSDYLEETYGPILKLCEENGLPYLFLLDYFIRDHDGKAPLFRLDKCHPSADGNEAVAEAIFNELTNIFTTDLPVGRQGLVGSVGSD